MRAIQVPSKGSPPEYLCPARPHCVPKPWQRQMRQGSGIHKDCDLLVLPADPPTNGRPWVPGIFQRALSWGCYYTITHPQATARIVFTQQVRARLEFDLGSAPGLSLVHGNSASPSVAESSFRGWGRRHPHSVKTDSSHGSLALCSRRPGPEFTPE